MKGCPSSLVPGHAKTPSGAGTKQCCQLTEEKGPVTTD
jgi:hypothetical protein